MAKCDIGIWGMETMGRNLALNIADSGFKVTVTNRTDSKTRRLMEEAEGKSIEAAYEVEDFIALLEKPRKILLMVSAGWPVDAVIDKLKPHLAAGDVIIDGGNSHYTDTERRIEDLEKDGILYLGMGISGGELGARFGPSMMPGGSKKAYTLVAPIMEKAAADFMGDPCVMYLGPRGAGHYVKMVHNGIEYAIMQAIAEVYDLMKRGMGMGAGEIAEVFTRWNTGELSSYLVEITGDIFMKMDSGGDERLIDMIMDAAKQKGTGKWTSQDAMDIGYPVPTISAAVEARLISARKDERQQAAEVLAAPPRREDIDRVAFIDALGKALYATEICAYAQGMGLLREASAEYEYNLNLRDVAMIWRDGCIIRSSLLQPIRDAYERDPDVPNILLDQFFRDALNERQMAWRQVIQTAAEIGIPTPAMGSALNYYDGYRSARLPANLIQAQRDYFGSHTYERIDKEGKFHTEWEEDGSILPEEEVSS